MATIADLTCAQYVPGAKDYDNTRYQYATSTYGESRNLKPGLIVQPRTKEDVARTLRAARERNVAVAVKTGGHQYSGASSTGGPNMQLDLEHSFRDADDRVVFADGSGGVDPSTGKPTTLVRTSVSWSLGEFNEWLAEHELFVPHGQCTEVHVGGHVQTGGYGQLGRSFGLLGDHVVVLELVDADGEAREVTRQSDPDLFFALLGGSPGNLGVLTHVTLRAHRDVDYEGSRGLKALFLYDRATLRRLMGILAEMADDEHFPRNYDLCVSVLSSSFPLLDLWPDARDDLDSFMSAFEREHYGDTELPAWPRSIAVYAQWVPFSPDDKPDEAWFERLREGSLWITGNRVRERPMSRMTGDWIFRNVREFEKPYVKRTYTTRSRTLGRDGWPDWVTGRIDDIVRPEANRCWLSAQLQCFGGRHSAHARHAGNGTAYSWRDTTLACTMDCFHEPETRGRAEDWQKVNDAEALGAEAGILSRGEDRRWLWGSWGDWDLDANWDRYYEDRSKYERLMRVRRRVDPYGTFTPNPFCVKRAEKGDVVEEGKGGGEEDSK